LSPDTCSTAILLFSRTAAEESVSKPLVRRAKKLNRILSARLIRQTHRLATDSGLPVFFISEKQQQGGTFGERFAHAFQQVFDQGYARVIGIGNDCPALRAKDLNVAADQLNAHSMVIGPAKDGGVYLIGLQKDHFDAVSFAAIRWQTASVLEDLAQWQHDDFASLDTKFDLDSEDDLRCALQCRVFSQRLSAWILAVLNFCYKSFFPSGEVLSDTFSPGSSTSRGPPSLTFSF
jgi:uncharacterized protein